MTEQTDLPGVFDDQPMAEPTEMEAPPAESAQTPQPEPIQEDQTAAQPDETSSHDDTPPAVKRVNLELEGEQFELELPETIADHVKNGVLMESKFRRDTQALAEKKREFESQIEAKERKQNEMLEELGSQLLFLQTELESDEMQDLKDLRPDEYRKKRLEYHDKYETYKKFAIEKQEQEAANREEAMKAYTQEQRVKLGEMIPVWADETTRKEEQKKIVDYAASAGFSEDEVRGMNQARIVKVFRDAMLYQDAQKRVESKKTNPVATPLKSSAKNETAKPKQLHEIFYGG